MTTAQKSIALLLSIMKIKNIEGVDTLYVLVSGDTVEDGARVTPGLGGLFILYKLGNSWVVSASSPYIKNGGAGRSGSKILI